MDKADLYVALQDVISKLQVLLNQIEPQPQLQLGDSGSITIIPGGTSNDELLGDCDTGDCDPITLSYPITLYQLSDSPQNCTCHPDDNPPNPCPQKHAYSECVEAIPQEVKSTKKVKPLFV